MSDSGRQYGDCKHARQRDACPECESQRLQKRVEALERALDWISVVNTSLPESPALAVKTLNDIRDKAKQALSKDHP